MVFITNLAAHRFGAKYEVGQCAPKAVPPYNLQSGILLGDCGIVLKGTHVELVCPVDAHSNEGINIIMHGLLHLIEERVVAL